MDNSFKLAISIFLMLIFSLIISFIILILIGNLTAMKLLVRNGMAVFCRKIEKDFTILKYINIDGVGWLLIPDVCYAPIMRFSDGIYKEHNFLKQFNMYGELYITEGESAKLLQNIALESNNEIKDLTIIRGSSKSNDSDIRYRNFSLLTECKDYVSKGIEVTLCDNGKIRKFKVCAVVDKTIGELHAFKYDTRDNFLDALLKIAEVKTVIDKKKQIILLQCNTEIETLTVILVEK